MSFRASALIPGGLLFFFAGILLSVGIARAQAPQDEANPEKSMPETLAAISEETERTSDPRPFSVPLPVSNAPFDYRSLDPADYMLEAKRATSTIEVDGHLDEAEWQQADVAGDFFQLEPVEGAPATHPTEVRVLYDDKNLYIGFICFDPNPENIMAPDMQRDTRMSFSNDMVTVVIASLDHYREAFEFQTNPNGARADSFVSSEGNNSDRDWNGLWNAASQVYDYGWSAEYVIPFHTLRFPKRENQTWGINFGRRIQRSREESYWVPLSLKDGDQALYRFGKGGRLTALSDITPGGRIQATPFTVLGAQSSRITESAPTPARPIAATALDNGMQRSLGGDLKVSVTSGMTLNATVNPDFAQVEADDEVVNLSRFEFQFTEKRPFFLERSDIFTLNQRPQRRGPQRRGGDLTPQLFFSRRVGRQLPDGQSVPIDLGMRLTGKIGHTTIGFLNVQTRETEYEDDGETKTEPLTNWQALRLARDLGSRSSVGMMATFKEPNPRFDDRIGMAIPRYAESDYNRVLGFDLNLASQRTNHRGQITFAKSWTDTLSTGNQDWTFRIIERWQNRWLMYGISYLDIGEDFIAQSGLVRDEGLQRVGGGLTANTFLRRFGIRRINGGFRSNYVTRKNTDFSDADSWSFQPNMFLELERGLWISASYDMYFDTLSETTRIAGVHFPAGSYSFRQGSLFLFTDSGRKVSYRGSFRYGRFYGADLLSLSSELSIKPNPRFALEPGITRSQVDRGNRLGLEDDEYDHRTQLIPSVRLSYAFTPNLSFSSFIQFNADRQREIDEYHLNTVTMNLLLAYRSPFGHSFFLAFNQFRDDDLDTDGTFGVYERTPLRLRDQQVVAKVSYLLNL